VLATMAPVTERQVAEEARKLRQRLARKEISPEDVVEVFLETVGAGRSSVQAGDFHASGSLVPLARRLPDSPVDDVTGPIEQFTQLFSLLDIWVCRGKAVDQAGVLLYVEVAFKASVSRPRQTQWIMHYLARITQGERGKLERYLRGRTFNPVYLSAGLAHPQGSFVEKLSSSDARIREAYFVALIGRINHVMCTCCYSRYTSTMTATGAYLLEPFHACISIPGDSSQGACANCIWKSREKSCTWAILRAINFCGVGMPPAPESPLNHQTCPRVTSNMEPVVFPTS
jgi:hypothetical protein